MLSVVLINDVEEQGLLAAILRGAGYVTLEPAETGEAVRTLMENKHELVIMAQETPPLEGVDLLPVVRSLTPAPIVVVGPDEEPALVQALFQGADAYVRRPVNPDELLARIRALLRRRGLRRPAQRS